MNQVEEYARFQELLKLIDDSDITTLIVIKDYLEETISERHNEQ